jgi:hypothetical protein
MEIYLSKFYLILSFLSLLFKYIILTMKNNNNFSYEFKNIRFTLDDGIVRVEIAFYFFQLIK